MPPKRSAREPAAVTALSRTLTRNPRVAPVRTWTATAPMSAGRVRGTLAPVTWGAATRARLMARPMVTIVGMTDRLPNGGTMRSQARARTRARTKPTTMGALMSTTTVGSASEQLRDLVEQLADEGDQRVEHPVPGEEEDERHRRQLGHEGEGELLDLRHRLEHGDEQAHGQADAEDGRHQLEGGEHGLDGQMDDVGFGHDVMSVEARQEGVGNEGPAVDHDEEEDLEREGHQGRGQHHHSHRHQRGRDDEIDN